MDAEIRYTEEAECVLPAADFGEDLHVAETRGGFFFLPEFCQDLFEIPALPGGRDSTDRGDVLRRFLYQAAFIQIDGVTVFREADENPRGAFRTARRREWGRLKNREDRDCNEPNLHAISAEPPFPSLREAQQRGNLTEIPENIRFASPGSP